MNVSISKTGPGRWEVKMTTGLTTMYGGAITRQDNRLMVNKVLFVDRAGRQHTLSTDPKHWEGQVKAILEKMR